MTSGALVTEPGCFSRIWLHKVCFRYVLFLSHRHGIKRIESRKSYKYIYIYTRKSGSFPLKHQPSTRWTVLFLHDLQESAFSKQRAIWEWQLGSGVASTQLDLELMETREGLQWVYCSLFAKICWEKKDLVGIRVEQNSYQVVKVQTNKNTE